MMHAARKANRQKLKESGVMKVVGDRGADVNAKW